jgi:hypothetical protein
MTEPEYPQLFKVIQSNAHHCKAKLLLMIAQEINAALVN